LRFLLKQAILLTSSLLVDSMFVAKRGIRRFYPCARQTRAFTGCGSQGFTLIEMIVVVVILAVLGASAIGRYVNLAQSARISAINGLAGSVNAAVALVQSSTVLHGPGSAGTQAGITFTTMADGTQVRLWNVYPDRWCDGVGITQSGASVPSGGCYLSTTAVPYGKFVFYGFGNSTIPNGDAGWRIETAPTPLNCAVGYNYGGTGTPAVIAYTSGC